MPQIWAKFWYSAFFAFVLFKLQNCQLLFGIKPVAGSPDMAVLLLLSRLLRLDILSVFSFTILRLDYEGCALWFRTGLANNTWEFSPRKRIFTSHNHEPRDGTRNRYNKSGERIRQIWVCVFRSRNRNSQTRLPSRLLG